jgi:deoxyribose-phosphate aldolase
MAAEVLLDSSVEVSTVAGFPHGNSTIDIKCREAEDAVNHGASEVDMVVNVGNVLGGNWNYVIRELESVHTTVRDAGGILKVIFENDFLEDEHIIRLTEIASDVGVAFIKTSTGYGFVKRENGMYTYYGAQDHHLKLMRKHADINVQIKAAGGIRTLDDLLRVRDLGVTRIGATATESILEAAMDRGFE